MTACRLPFCPKLGRVPATRSALPPWDHERPTRQRIDTNPHYAAQIRLTRALPRASFRQMRSKRRTYASRGLYPGRVFDKRLTKDVSPSLLLPQPSNGGDAGYDLTSTNSNVFNMRRGPVCDAQFELQSKFRIDHSPRTYTRLRINAEIRPRSAVTTKRAGPVPDIGAG